MDHSSFIIRIYSFEIRNTICNNQDLQDLVYFTNFVRNKAKISKLQMIQDETQINTSLARHILL